MEDCARKCVDGDLIRIDTERGTAEDRAEVYSGCWVGGVRVFLSQGIVRWDEAAGWNSACPRAPAGGVVDGRAILEPRCVDSREPTAGGRGNLEGPSLPHWIGNNGHP